MNNRKIIGPQNEQSNRKIIVPDGNNRNDGDVKDFQKIIGIESLLKNEPSTSPRSEN